jgi:hypothetical protein
MKKLRFTWDRRGRLIAVGQPPQDVLADYLANELQEDRNACRRVLDTVRRVKAGHCENWEREGDSWSLRLTGDIAEFTSEHAVPGRRLKLPLQELEEAVASWLQFIEVARS